MTFVSSLAPVHSLSERLIFVAVSCIPLAVWLTGVGNIFAYFYLKVPEGQIFYIFSKLAGLYAYYFMALQLILGFQGRGSQYFRYHATVGVLTTLTVVAHLCLFIMGAALKTKHIPVEILWPTFSSGYYKSSISYGAIAAYLLMLIFIAGFMQRKFIIFKVMHRLAPAVVLLGWVHSFGIGTETRSLPTMAFYLTFFCLALYVFLKKIGHSVDWS